MANHNLPLITSLYEDYTAELKSRHDDALKMLDPATTSPTNLPTNAIRFSSAAGKWQKWNGTSWVDLVVSYAINISGNAATATTLQTARLIGGVSFNGSADINLPGVNTPGNQDTSGSAATLASGQSNWGGTGVINNVVGLLAWKNYSNHHVIFDASSGTTPSGASCNNADAQKGWIGTHPTLMGWNGVNTHGVRVDSARIADNATNASTANNLTANALSQIYPVGSIYINADVTTNPATLLGFGTWVAFGAGRVIVGLNGSDTLFDTLEETGGSKDAIVVSHTHTATVTDPGHIHSVTYGSASNTSSVYPSKLSTGAFSDANTNSATTGITVANSTEGSSGTNANLQPYITVAMWKRTA